MGAPAAAWVLGSAQDCVSGPAGPGRAALIVAWQCFWGSLGYTRGILRQCLPAVVIVNPSLVAVRVLTSSGVAHMCSNVYMRVGFVFAYVISRGDTTSAGLHDWRC